MSAPSLEAHLALAVGTELRELTPAWFDPALSVTMEFVLSRPEAEVAAFRASRLAWLASFLRDVPRGDPRWASPARFEALLSRFDYSDVAAASLLDPAIGAPLIGVTGGPAHWPEEPYAPTPAEPLSDFAERCPQSFASRAKPSRWDKELAAATQKDLATGKVLGPFESYEELCAAVGGASTPALRFGVDQGSKVRPCDDYSADGQHVNAHFRTSRKLRLSDLRTVAPWFSRLRSSGCRVRLWKRDLHEAYRQVPLSPEHIRFASFCFFDPEAGRVRYYCHTALPFGATAAVYGFNRVAAALTFLANEVLRVPVTNFFDDFFSLDLEGLSQGGFDAFGSLCDLLGIVIKPSKDVPPCAVGELLGVDVDLSGERLLFRLQAARRSKLVLQLDAAVDSGVLPPGAARKLAGKLSFALMAIFGQVGRAALGALFKHATSAVSPHVGAGLRAALLFLSRVLRVAPPAVPGAILHEPRILYTDASDERGGSIGAVLVIPGLRAGCVASCTLHFFGMSLPRSVTRALIRRRQQIAAYELLAVLVALETFARFLQSSRSRAVLLFVDNTTALGWLRNGFARGDVSDLQPVVTLFWDLLLRWRLDFALEWVASALNISDAPSRPLTGSKTFLRERHARAIVPVADLTFACVTRDRGT